MAEQDEACLVALNHILVDVVHIMSVLETCDMLLFIERVSGLLVLHYGLFLLSGFAQGILFDPVADGLE